MGRVLGEPDEADPGSDFMRDVGANLENVNLENAYLENRANYDNNESD